MGAKEKNQHLYKPNSSGKWLLYNLTFNIFQSWTFTCWSVFTIYLFSSLLSPVGIIAKEPASSLQQEIQELRGSASCLRSEPEFEMADIFYFCRRGVESIMDDEVTKRFSAQELESWNLLTRSNYNFRHISLRVTVLWGLGVLIRYGVLLPMRSELCSASTLRFISSYKSCKRVDYWSSLTICSVFCRVTLAVTGVSLLLVLSTLVCFLPNRE